ncbi:MAG: GDP-mannose 4,6-dehydratase [Nitrospinae bacterium]|nr:GDP-mannose 4,6-dehydratase [Nitrospinota bacterium]
MKCLITGGAGFIGSHLSEELLNRGDVVYIIDDLSTGSIKNVEHLKNNPRFHSVVDTIFNQELLEDLIEKVDVIYHLAAAVGVKLIVESPVRTIETNIKGTEIVLNLANKHNKKVMIASTSEVYGKSTKVPFNEEDDMVIGQPKRGRWSYACSKAIDEFLAMAYYHEKGLPVTIFRFFNTVGPRQTGRYGMVIPSFIAQALSNKPITVYGSGEQSRSFTWIGDVVRGLIDITNHPKSNGELYNLGHGKEISILKLAELIKEMTKSKSKIVKIPYEKAYESGFEDMMQRVPDISKAHKLINYSPTLDIKDILQNIIEHFRSESYL